MSKKHRWRLQIYWKGGWRALWNSEDYRELTEYVEHCPPELEFRMIDSLEETPDPSNRRRKSGRK